MYQTFWSFPRCQICRRGSAVSQVAMFRWTCACSETYIRQINQRSFIINLSRTIMIKENFIKFVIKFKSDRKVDGERGWESTSEKWGQSKEICKTENWFTSPVPSTSSCFPSLLFATSLKRQNLESWSFVLKQAVALWQVFFAKISQFFKAVILTLGVDWIFKNNLQ